MFLNYLNVFLEEPIAQLIGLFALFFTIIWFVSKKDNIFIIFMVIASFLWWIHFFMLWLLSASFINFFDTIKNYLAFKYKKNKYIFIFFLFSYFLIGLISIDFNNYISIIPVFNSIFWLILIFYFKWIKLKLWFIFIVSLWFLYNYFWNSIAWMISDLILFFSWLIGVYNLSKSKILDNFI